MGMSRIEELKQYKELLDTGVITQAEYDAKKQVLLTNPELSAAPQAQQPTQPNQTVAAAANGVENYMKSVTAVPNATGVVGNKSKIVAGLLGVFLGTFGVHNFYLGNTSRAVTQLVASIVGLILSIFIVGIFIMAGIEIWAFIEGILIISSHQGSKWHLDGKGNELVD